MVCRNKPDDRICDSRVNCAFCPQCAKSTIHGMAATGSDRGETEGTMHPTILHLKSIARPHAFIKTGLRDVVINLDV